MTSKTVYNQEFYEKWIKPWRNRNRKRLNASHSAYYHNVRKYKIYNITKKDYDDLLKKQGGVCAICKKKNDNIALTIDHDHKTGKARGLLCRNCNWMIGLAQDDMNTLSNAKKYLNKYNKQTNLMIDDEEMEAEVDA